MKPAWRTRLRRSGAACLGGSLIMVLLAYGLFSVGLRFQTASLLLLTILALLSLNGRFFDSVVLTIVAIGCLNFYFVTPVFSFSVADPLDLAPIVAFLTTSLIITGLAAKTRKRAEEELQQTQAALARFARVAVLGELTASIAHEVSQPLAGVVSSGNACLRWLASDPPNIDKATQSVTRIIRDANRAAEIVQRVRGLVKNAPPQKGWMSLNDAIAEVIALAQGEFERNRIALVLHLPEGLPQVWADRIQLQQVLLNLVGNAVDALRLAPGAQKELTIRTALADGSVVATVQDNGIGLDQPKLQDVFKPFYTTKSEGMGMGLAISRSIVEAHAGRLWAEAAQPRGAIFRFALPLGPQE